MQMVRGTALSGYQQLVRSLGYDPQPFLANYGIDSAAIGSYEEFIEYQVAARLVEHTAAATGCTSFGRRLADLQGVSVLGPVGIAAISAPTVRRALSTIRQYISTVSSHLTIGFDIEGPRAFMSIDDLTDTNFPHTKELTISLALSVFRRLIGSEWNPLTVSLTHRPLEDPSHYTRWAKCKVEFSQIRLGFALETKILDREIEGNTTTHHAMLSYLTEAHLAAPDFEQAVREIVRTLLPSGHLSLRSVANNLAISERTLQRRLANEGVDFSSIVDGVRRSLAERYLGNTQMSMGQLARELGYQDQAILSRSCHRWFGDSPSRTRINLQTMHTTTYDPTNRAQQPPS